MLALNLWSQMFKVQAAPKAQRRKLGGFGHFARLIAGNEPLEVRKRFPQILDQFVGVRFVCLWSHSHVLCCRLNPRKLILKGVRGNTCRSTRVVCGNAHPVDFVGGIKATEHLL